MASYEQSPTVLDISSSHNRYFPAMVGWENRHEEAYSDRAAEKENLVSQLIVPSYPWDGLLRSHGYRDWLERLMMAFVHANIS